ncbi:bifunctional 3-(3-hydroxy-phenyl)propionate/3-hydroxycinnamic acid hydroxylase [Amycolatopsis sp. NPDC059021]|uniref:bifunctional 3-(3-hydroxy-phenyl)propionate/3-hydroxycinnamic acid hydroxylase MhpA n=1 Tax=Amycolatopsis sp. NPDC059021 TaxID=3346704 RepID=UPI00366C1C86
MDIHDVIVVGAGPVGLLTARLLGLAGHDVHVVERWPEPYPLPRAVHFDHEIGRLLQSAGLADRVREISARVPDHYEWRNRDGETLVKIDWSLDGSCGWPVANFFSQPDLEAVLAGSLGELPTVRLSRGLEVVGIREGDRDVELTVSDRAARHHRLRARYVVGCDGANSFVRRHLNPTLIDLGFHFDWLIVDVLPHDEQDWSPMNWQLCDPARPTTIVSGGPGRRRWEFMRLPGEDRDRLDTEETAWRLLEPWGRTPENTTIERHAVYTFQARWAEEWTRGRLALAGDAAHQMPPFAGQGMCSGLRDAANLAWKLDRVLGGVCEPAILDTYTTERRDHLQHAVSMSVALGRTICVLDEDEARARDKRMLASHGDPREALPPMPPERLGEGAWEAVLTPPAVRATLTPQFQVRDGDVSGLLDDVSEGGPGFLLLGYGVDPAVNLTEEQTAVCDVLGVRSVMLVEAHQASEYLARSARTRSLTAGDEQVRDWFVAAGVTVVLVRPDFYAYGAVTDPGRVGDLIDRLRSDLAVANIPVRQNTAG